ncbi:MAG TPA: alcohol dehydrogenase catalytic domain-containing protein [Candidatus Binatus sp.]|uniref:alcohol dehydrogenase catalytic domain-containing protein n=1 Tax=Candidatus Binatus sp. TaxID=2811406 RepID=UPI002B46A391|nr:alcohol dehydrogenase catalytic domain-containing protein [Candidatus Binatus sp.]HKN12447.1 alcohol dehydrogenase catalytic domain-containing protein [Candidatus Binatus sp.]
MQVARLYDFGDIRVEESARPVVGDGDILVRASACGICSGDIMPWYIKRKAPLVLGHEPVGVVEQTGASVRGFKTGDRVFVHHHAPCFQCAACRRGEYVQCATWRATNIVPGGMAEFFLVSAANQRDTLQLPDSIADADGVLIEPAACVVKSLKRSGLKTGESILIIGLGIMGMMHVKLARHLGAGTIIGADLFHSRASRALELGADRAIVVEGDNLVEQVREITNGAMADVVIVGPGTSKAITAGIASAGKGATVVQFTATPPDDELLVKPHDLYFNETRLVPSYSCGPNETREAFALVERGVINAMELVTHRFPLARITEAFATAQKPESLKVIVTFAS